MTLFMSELYCRAGYVFNNIYDLAQLSV